jgi:hypothetical protein
MHASPTADRSRPLCQVFELQLQLLALLPKRCSKNLAAAKAFTLVGFPVTTETCPSAGTKLAFVVLSLDEPPQAVKRQAMRIADPIFFNLNRCILMVKLLWLFELCQSKRHNASVYIQGLP